MANILQEFLDIGLFNYGDEDQRLKDFQAASEDLAEGFSKSPHKVIEAILVAIDPAVPDDDPVLDEAEAAIKGHWNSFRNKFPERPKGFLRPVLLDAISQAASENADIASAIWLSGVSLLPHLDVSKEIAILENFLLGQGTRMEALAEESWALSQPGAQFQAPALAFKLPKSQAAKVDKAALEEGLAWASGPQNRQNKTYESPNPYWPNQGANWSYDFASRAATTISDQVNNALAQLASQAGVILEQVEPELNKFGKELSTGINHWVNASVGGLAKRSAVIWWKEALYSPSLRKSYRELSPIEVAVSMALDLHQLTAAPVPQSVEFFLRETVHSVLPKGPKATIAEILAEASQSSALAPVAALAAPPDKLRRVSLLTAIQIARQAKFKDDDVPACVGVGAELKLPVAELAVWLFRDAQAYTLTHRSAKK